MYFKHYDQLIFTKIVLIISKRTNYLIKDPWFFPYPDYSKTSLEILQSIFIVIA